MSVLFVVAGPSGVGKSTLCVRLREEFPDLRLSVSTTTRAPRAGEVDGVHYHFVDRATFDAQVAAGRFVEWAEVHGNLYGTSRETVDAELAVGRSVLFDIDVQGAASLRDAYPANVVTTMVLPPDGPTLERRLRGRNADSDAVIATRLRNAVGEIARSGEFQHAVFNDDFETAYDELRAIFVAARTRVSVRGAALRAWVAALGASVGQDD